MTGWRLAIALVKLRDEVNALYPHRDKAADGTIGDVAHQNQGSASDHNPWVYDALGNPVVRAFDITAASIPAAQLAEHLRFIGSEGDRRLANHGYVIFDGRIASETANWAWRPYPGDPHTSHIHMSVSRSADGYDSPASWGLGPMPAASHSSIERLVLV